MSLPVLSVLPRCVAFADGANNYDNDGFLYLEVIEHPKREREDYLKFGERTSSRGEDDATTSRSHTRFRLDPSKEHADEELVHVRSSYNNKYLVARELMEKDPHKYKARKLYDGGYLQPPDDEEGLPSFLIDLADEPEEDLSKSSCTLFRIRVQKSDYLGPLQGLGRHHRVSFFRPQSDEKVGFLNEWRQVYRDIILLDVSEQTILPPYVVFKIVEGEDDLYLKVFDDDYYLQFASTDIADKSVRFKTYNYADGSVRLKSLRNDMFLKVTDDNNWIRAVGQSVHEDGTIFKALKYGDFFALKTVSNNKGGTFCTCSKSERLAVGEESITGKAKFMLEEPVLSREIYNVRYHENGHHSRVYDTKNVSIATATAINRTGEKNTVKSSMSIITKESSKWEATATKASTQVTFHAWFALKLTEFLEVDGGWKTQYGHGFSHATTWGKGSEYEKKQEVDYEVTVPANKKVTLSFTATQATYDVPFSYTQKDKLLNGVVVTEDYDDGLYTGTNCFDLRYETKEEDIDFMTSSSKKGEEAICTTSLSTYKYGSFL